MTTTKTSGGCQCGNVRFEAEGAPKFVSNCHCQSCRKATGAGFSSWVGFRASDTKWTAATPSFYASSPGVQRGYCADCGTPLSYASEKWAGELHFLIGVFDDPAQFTPANNACEQEALAWALQRSDN